MKNELELNEMILNISNKIRADRPELLEYLDEMPMTVPYSENPEMVITNLRSYYDSLVVLLDKKDNDNLIVKNAQVADIMPIPIINTMALETVYQNLILEINNCTISYIDMGKSEIPIIFLHGFPFDKSMWNGQLDVLKNNYRVLAVDIRGFGQSKDEKTPLSIDLFTDDLLSFMDKLNIEKAIICGLSMGGYIVLNAVNKFPTRFSAILLCDTQCIADSPEVKENRYKTIEKIQLSDANEFNENFIKNVFCEDSFTSKIEVVDHLRSTVIANSKEIIIAGLIALAERSETCSILHKINVPTLIICGKDDKVTPLAQSEMMQKNIKNATLKIIENAGHVSNLEQPEEFNKHILNFLNTIEN